MGMKPDLSIPGKSNSKPSPEDSSLESTKSTCNSSSRSSFSLSDSSKSAIVRRKLSRTKSLSHLVPESYSQAEIRRLRDRLLRTSSRVETDELKSFSHRQKLTLAVLALVDFIAFCSMSIMAPFFPREAAEKGLSDTLTGFAFSFFALIMFLTSPIFGKILPKVGARFLFLSGMFVAGSCNFLFGMLEYIMDYTLFTTFCFIIRGLEALGASAFSTASYVFVINTFPDNIGSVLGILETFVGLGMSTGPAIGGILYSLGGFEMPFFVLGSVMILLVPLNIFILPSIGDDCNITNRSTSLLKLLKVPSVVLIGSVVVVISSTWAFLDPTLEPHLRQFNLTPEQIGLIFLLFSSLYGLSSPGWGWLADKIQNHWSMMIMGLLLSTVGLLLLGPSPYITSLESSLWLNIVALSILGISVALALLPTFQGVLQSAIDAGLEDSISTYSVVAGIWSCMYSLGEVIGPSLGGFLLSNYGFPMTSTVMAGMNLSLAVFLIVIYLVMKMSGSSDTFDASDSGITESSFTNSHSNLASEASEKTPLLYSVVGTSHLNQNLSHRLYTEEKVQYYEQSRKLDGEGGTRDYNQITDVRGTVTITHGGACEV